MAEQRRYPIDFSEPPPIGHTLQIGKRLARLERVEPITRKSDGASSWLLHWSIDGRKATSGLRAGGVHYLKEGDDARAVRP